MNKEKLKQGLLILSLVAIIIIFFSYNIVICVDSSHYCWLSSLLSKGVSFSNWDVARGIVFPLIIYILTAISGNNVISLQIGMFIAYACVLIIAYLVYKDINKEYKLNKYLKTIIYVLFLGLIVFNPLILGYYHTILTEYISMTTCIVISYFAWKWIDIDFMEHKIKYIIYTLYFACSMAFMWHLKQPYVLTVLAPALIAALLSIIKEFNWKNVVQRFLTIIVCIVTLIISLKLWNFALKIGNVTIEEGRTSSGFLSNQIVGGLSEYTVIGDENEYKIENINNSSKISDEDKEKIEAIINGTSEKYKDFTLVECAPYRNIENSKKIEVIYKKSEQLSVGEAVKFETLMFFKNPKSIINGYINNYLTTVGIYKAQTVGIGAIVTKKTTFSGTYENSYIAYNIYRDTTNNLNIPEHYYKYIEKYDGINRQIKVVNNVLIKMQPYAIYSFKIFLLLVPFLFISSFIIFIVFKMKNKKSKKVKIYEILTILYGYSFLNVLMYSILGALIDRYAISSYIAVNFGILIHLYYLVSCVIERLEIKRQN